MGFNPIAKRVGRLRMAKSELARSSSLHENTVARALLPEPRVLTSTQAKIERALDVEELALRDYLLALHPLPAPPQPERTA